NNNVTNNTANSNSNYGIILTPYCSYNTVSDNTATNNFTGIGLGTSNDNEICSNNLSDNERALSASLGQYNSYTNNDLSNSTSWALMITGESQFEQYGNDFSNSVNGIRLVNMDGTSLSDIDLSTIQGGTGLELTCVTNSSFSNITVSGGKYGILIWQSSTGNIFYDNIVSDCIRGIQISSNSSDNLIYNNWFYYNTIQASVDSSSSSIFNLDKPIGGNYWSDWTLPDADDDGFVDYPYVFNYGQDNLPWADPDGWLNQAPVASAGGPYLVEVDSSIMLDTSGSYDPDGDTLEGWWELYDPALGQIDGSIFYASYQAGITYVTLTVDDGIATSTDETMLVIYDPEGGFVTGGGWIWSPAGAYYFDPWLEGKANFGFVSKYKKGANIPTGQTEFIFHAGDLNFHSSSYEWLVVTGSDYARFKGLGSINGFGDYKFMLWAGDGNPDTFRIKIWTEDELGVETIVYDNGFDQAIGGGNIIVHTN
ncbi:NosD domain-containing protein, partial [Planctomycetota bacterium]